MAPQSTQSPPTPAARNKPAQSPSHQPTFGVQSTGGNGVLNIGGYPAKASKGPLGVMIGASGVVGGRGKELGDKSREGWNEGTGDGRSSVLEGKEGEAFGRAPAPPPIPAAAAATAAPGGRGYEGVMVTIDREVNYTVGAGAPSVWCVHMAYGSR